MLTSRRFGSAKKCYEKGRHPRLFFTAKDVEELKERVKSSHGETILQALTRKVRVAMRSVPPGASVVELAASAKESERSVAASLSSMSFDLALVGLLAESEAAIRTVCEVIEAIPGSVASAPPGKDNRREIPYAPYLAYDLVYDTIPPDVARRFREWSLTEAIEGFRPLMERGAYVAAGMNVPLSHCRCALIPALAIQGDPGVPDLSGVIETGARFMKAFCRTGIGVDGYPEEDVGYGTSCVVYATEIGEILFRAGLFNMFQDARWRKFGRALVHFLQPWGQHLTVTGDFGHDPSIRAMGLARVAHEAGDPTILWLLSNLDFRMRAAPVKLANGLKVMANYSSLFYLDVYDRPRKSPQQARLPTAFCDHSRGIISVRSSWDKDATYAHLDSSQRHASVMGHWHCSAGHFSLSALGEYFSVDTGRYNCDYDQHSVMLVDGQSPNSTQGEWGGVCVMGRLLDYTPGPLLDTTRIDSSQMNDCFWAWRTIGLVKGDGGTPYLWTVDDVNKANDFREFWWTMQTHPKNRIRIRREEATVTGFRHGNLLNVGFAYPAPEEYPEPHSLRVEKGIITTSSWKYVGDSMYRMAEQREPLSWSVLKRPRLIAKLSGYNGKLMSVMVPRRKGRKPVRMQRLSTVPNALAMKIHFPRVTDTLIYAYEHGFLEADDIAGVGDLVLVRRSRKTGEVLDYAMRNGEKLVVAGQRLRPKE